MIIIFWTSDNSFIWVGQAFEVSDLTLNLKWFETFWIKVKNFQNEIDFRRSRNKADK
jgi:hypothetical protein